MVDANYIRIADIFKFSADRELIENAVRDLIRLRIDHRPIMDELSVERRREVSKIARPIFEEHKANLRNLNAENLESHHRENGAAEMDPEDEAALAALTP